MRTHDVDGAGVILIEPVERLAGLDDLELAQHGQGVLATGVVRHILLKKQVRSKSLLSF